MSPRSTTCRRAPESDRPAGRPPAEAPAAAGTGALDRPGGTRASDEATRLLGDLLRALGVPETDLDPRVLRAAVHALGTLTRGYGEHPQHVVGDALFRVGSTEPVAVREIPFVSLCAERVLPFQGRAHVVYLPGDRVVGLSKIARLVDLYAARLQTPGRLADGLAHAVSSTLGARGVSVRIEARYVGPGASGVVRAGSDLGDFRLPVWRERLGWMF